MRIESIATAIAGFNSSYGELIPTKTLLEWMKDPKDDQFDTGFIENRIGIKSVAVSQSTLNWIKQNQTTNPTDLFTSSQLHPNHSTHQMLEEAILKCIQKNCQESCACRQNEIVAHFHILSFGSLTFENYMLDIRKKLNIPNSAIPLHTFYIQQGCSGILTLLQIAEPLLLASNKNAQVLITAENNLMPIAHQRLSKNANSHNINEWLFPAIFGEGVGAMLVGKPDNFSCSLKKTIFDMVHLESKPASKDWRVALQYLPEEKTARAYIKAKEVAISFVSNMLSYGQKAIEQLGEENIFAHCFHESNPVLVATVQDKLNIPKEKVPTFSAQIGTLGSVSAFNLLEHAFKQYDASSQPAPYIVANLIGEAGRFINAGQIVLKTNSQ